MKDLASCCCTGISSSLNRLILLVSVFEISVAILE